MKISDITNSALSLGKNAAFRRALKCVLLDECEFDHDGVTIRKEMPDSSGWTFAGLNQSSDGLPVDAQGNVLATTDWIVNKYEQNYWNSCKCNSLLTPLNIILFIQAVNEGNETVAILLQRALNDYGNKILEDGIIGPHTISAVMSNNNIYDLCRAFISKSKAYYIAVVRSNPNKQKDLQGWFNRLDKLQEEFLTE